MGTSNVYVPVTSQCTPSPQDPLPDRMPPRSRSGPNASQVGTTDASPLVLEIIAVFTTLPAHSCTSSGTPSAPSSKSTYAASCDLHHAWGTSMRSAEPAHSSIDASRSVSSSQTRSGFVVRTAIPCVGLKTRVVSLKSASYPVITTPSPLTGG